jgi:hypothetical protein
VSFERLEGLVFLFGGLDVETPLQKFQANFELKLDNNSGGLLCKKRC